MDIKKIIIAVGLIPLLISCKKKNLECPKAGYEYVYTNLKCWYNPSLDSVPVGTIIVLEASAPKTFIDENTGAMVTNTCSMINGPLGIAMIYPTYQAAADSFELSAEIGKVIKDTIQFTSGQLRGFRTIEWNGNSSDSFRMKINIKPLVKGIYDISLGQQGCRDGDCALFKYFLKVGSDQHLHYWADFNNGIVDDYAKNYAYCFKVY